MQSKTIFEYVLFGTRFRYLLDANEGWPLFNKNDSDSQYILENIQAFLQQLDEFQLPVSKRAAWKINNLEAQIAERLIKAILTTMKGVRLKKRQKEVMSVVVGAAKESDWRAVNLMLDVNQLPDAIRIYLRDAVLLEMKRINYKK